MVVRTLDSEIPALARSFRDLVSYKDSRPYLLKVETFGSETTRDQKHHFERLQSEGVFE